MKSKYDKIEEELKEHQKELGKFNKWVYGGGPITGLTDKQYLGWRLYAKSEFEKEEIGFFIPTRFEGPMGEKMGFLLDMFYILHSKTVFMNLLGSKNVTIGTMFEYGWESVLKTANDLGLIKSLDPKIDLDKTLITIIEQEENPHIHSFVREASDYIFEDLDSGISLAKKILLTPDN
jgi:hypothetical protein